MRNRYDELTDEQQRAFDLMINAVASHQGDMADIMTDTAHLSLREMEQKLWRIAYKKGKK